MANDGVHLNGKWNLAWSSQALVDLLLSLSVRVSLAVMIHLLRVVSTESVVVLAADFRIGVYRTAAKA